MHDAVLCGAVHYAEPEEGHAGQGPYVPAPAMHDLDRLIEGVRSLLAERGGYSASTISHHERAWRRLGIWCRENGHSSYSRLVQDEYFRERGFDRRRLGKLESGERTQVRRLLEYAETGGFACAAASSPRSVPPEGMEAAAEGYRAHLEGKGLRRRTIAGYMVSVRQFCATCGASTPDRLSQASATWYIEGLGGYAAQTKASKLYAVRSFLRFLAGHGLCSGEAAECIEPCQYNGQGSVFAGITRETMVCGHQLKA